MDFVGNKKAVNILQRSIHNKTMSHAYLFSGPEKVGKFTLAKMFALAAIAGAELNCDVQHADKDALLDLLIIAPEIVEKNKVFKQRDISIEAIREAKLSLSLFPYHGKYKVLIIRNALLKILEEPNPTTMLILVTHELDRILPTILSRCQMVNFTLASDAELRAAAYEEDIISLSIGRPGLASALSRDEVEKNFRLDAQNQFENVIAGSLNEKFVLADEYSKDVVKTLEKLNIWIWELRKKALSGSENDCSAAFAKIEKIQKAASVLKRTNANSKLILETLFMDL